VGAVIRGRMAVLAGMTGAVVVGLVPLPALAGVVVLAGLLGALEVRGVRGRAVLATGSATA
jgi:hypothetical protein